MKIVGGHKASIMKMGNSAVMNHVRDNVEAEFNAADSFDADWYLEQYPDVKMLGIDPLEHYLWIGQRLGRWQWGASATKSVMQLQETASNEKMPSLVPTAPISTPTSEKRTKFECFYTSEVTETDEEPALSPLMHYVWRSRPDLQSAFDCTSASGREAFINWCARNFVSEYGLPLQPMVAPIENLRDNGVNLIGYARAPSGRGEDVRAMAQSLNAQGLPFALLDIPPAGSHANFNIEDRISIDQPYRTNIFHVNADMFPIEVLKYGQGHYNVGYWAWELAGCPPAFDDALHLTDEIWGISEFVSQAFRARAKVPVHTMPLAVSVPELPTAAYSKARFGLEERPFTFLFTFDALSYLDRKNPVDVVRAFKQAFRDGRTDVCLVLKTHNVEKVMGSPRANSLWNELLMEIANSPRIRIIDSTFERQDVLSLTAACDAFVSLHRSEGFGRNLVEAMLYGRPVIATGYSGSSEFIRSDTAIPIDYSLIPVGQGAYPNSEGQSWAQPNIDHAAWAMRRLVEDDAWRNEIARAGQSFARANYNESVIGRRYVERLQALLGPHVSQVPIGYNMQQDNDVIRKLCRHVHGKDTVLFTIVSQNYMAFARTVLQSVREQHPEFALFICVVDEADTIEFPEMEDFHIVRVRDINLPNFLDMRLRYDVMELNTAVKPFFIDWIYSQTAVEKVIYFDPDLFLYRPLIHVLGPLDSGHSVVLTPHINNPIEDDGFSPTDHSIMQSGVFNLGFIATRRCDETRRFIQWWARQLETASVSDVQNNLFTDQRWCDFAPCFLSKLKVLHHEGHNVAYWNLDQRLVEKKADGTMIVNGEPLVFFHFSGFHPRRLEQVSKHQTRFNWENISLATRELMQAYGERLLANGYETAAKAPYSYDVIDGLKIRPVMRQIYRNAYPSPQIFHSEGEARKHLVELCLEQTEASPADGGEPFSRLKMQIYQMRPDVQNAFPIASAQGAAGFRGWLNHSIKNEYDIDLEALAQAR